MATADPPAIVKWFYNLIPNKMNTSPPTNALRLPRDKQGELFHLMFPNFQGLGRACASNAYQIVPLKIS